jgi:hypothetical protein
MRCLAGGRKKKKKEGGLPVGHIKGGACNKAIFTGT